MALYDPNSLSQSGTIMALRLDKVLRKQVADRAAERGISSSELTRDALALYLTLTPDEIESLGIARAAAAANETGIDLAFWIATRRHSIDEVCDGFAGKGPLAPQGEPS